MKPRRPRRTQAERTKATRAKLAAAAYETAATGGLNALRMRAVADAAGVSQGALIHHFPHKASLVIAAIRYALELAARDSTQWTNAPAQNREDLLRAMLAEFRAFFFSDRFWVAMGVTLEASKDPEFYPEVRATVSALRTPIYAAWTERLVGMGWSAADAARTVRSGAEMISGAAIRKFWAEPDAIAAEVEEAWLSDRLRT